MSGFIEYVADFIVTGNSFAVNAAGNGVMTKLIARAATSGAEGILLENRGPQAVECRASELLRVKSETKSRRR